ncbi:MAG: site-specific DNA-methyltransferase [SAR324 cluster bacterium]|nr:site-specific DNA-methyltransferase [SAR324 cluster bacterium]
MDKLPLTSMNIPEEQQNKLKELFPEVFTEGNKIDWNKLRLTLGEQIDVGKERYGMNWPGKADCFKTIQQPSIGTLVPCPEESVDFDTTQNLFIEGDNLEVLKLLQKSYLGKVKMIYIDPPYNTGNDFIYPDNYSESLETYLSYTGQVDEAGRKFSTNTDTDGRFHSKWMNMMYPRLFLAKNLLREDGVIFVSIDENEAKNLRAVMDEIFGEENFSGEIVWKNSSKNDQAYISIQHEYILCYVRNKSENNGEWSEKKEGLNEIYKAFDGFRKKHGNKWDKIHEEAVAWYKQFPESNPIFSSKHYSWMDENGVYFPDNISGPNFGQYRYDVIHPVAGKVCKEPSSGWRFPEETMKQRIADNLVHFGKDESTIPNNKTYLKNTESQSLSSIKYKDGRVASKLLIKLLGGNYFTNPKDANLLGLIIKAVLKDNCGIILDFFSGSCTTAHAVLDLNKSDGGNRKFIMVQLPELCDENSEAYKAGYKTIADIGKERIRRVIKKIKEEQNSPQGDLLEQDQPFQDLGFKVFKLSKSNFNIWNANVEKAPESIQQQLELHIDHIDQKSSQEAILYEILLKSGFELTTAIEKLNIESKTVFSIAEGELLICLEKQLTLEVIRAIAERKPSRVVCLDEGFQHNDQLKTNAVQIMKSKGVLNFRTV